MAAPRVYITYTAGGGGHRSVASALSQQLQSAYGWEVVLVNPYRDMGSYVDIFRILTGQRAEDLYNRLLRHFFPTYVPYPFFHVFYSLIRLNRAIYGWKAVQKMAEYWRRECPDLVVSVMPLINDLLAKSLELARAGTRLVTVMTDYDECTSGMWISPPLPYVICPSRRALQRAASRGHPPEKILSAPGIIVAPEFYEDSAAYKTEQRERLGLVRGIPAGLVMFGRQGASRLLKVARVMTRAQYPVQLIFICGHDDQTADAIRALPTNYHKVVFGFVSDVHRHMAAADFFVGKPGPSSIAEALARGLPMILDFGWRTMLQDRYNAQWAADHGVAVLNRGMRKLPDSIRTLLDRYDQYRSAARTASTGKALFDVAALLERYVAGARVRSD